MVAYGERVLHGLAPTASGRVPDLYFPERVHACLRRGFGRQGAGLRLFDLVTQAALPEAPHAKARSRKEATSETSSSPRLGALASSRETSFLPRLCQALDKLAFVRSKVSGGFSGNRRIEVAAPCAASGDRFARRRAHHHGA